MDRPDREELVQLIFRRERQLLILVFLSSVGLVVVGDRALTDLEFPSPLDWILIVPTLCIVCTSALRFSRIIQIARKAELSVAVPWGEGFKSLCAALVSSAFAGMMAFGLVLAYRSVALAWSLWRGPPPLVPPSSHAVAVLVFIPVQAGAFFVFSLISMRRARTKFVSCVRAAAGICVRCGYSLAGIDSARCPECGTSRPTPEATVDKAS